MTENNQSNPNSSFEPEKMVKELKKEFVVVGKPRVRLMYTYLIVALLLGAALAIAYVASNTDLSGTAAYPFPFDDDDDGKVPGGGGIIACSTNPDKDLTAALQQKLADLENFKKAAEAEAKSKGTTLSDADKKTFSDEVTKYINDIKNTSPSSCNSATQTECSPASCQLAVSGRTSADVSVGCSCGGSTTAGPGVAPAASQSCEKSPAPACGGSCSGGGKCAAKTYSPCDPYDPASGYTEN